MCFFYNTWLRGVTPLTAYTQHKKHLHTHTQSLVKHCVIILPGQPLCRDPQRFGHTLFSLPDHSANPPPPLAVVPGCLASCFICTSVEKPHRSASMCVSVCVCLTEIDTHRIMCIYIWSSHQGLCSTPLLFPPPWVNHLHFHFFFFFIEMKLSGFKMGREEERFQRLPPTVLRHFCRAGEAVARVSV